MPPSSGTHNSTREPQFEKAAACICGREPPRQAACVDVCLTVAPMRRRPIAAHNLREVYGPKAAVDGLNLEVPRGSAARLLLRCSWAHWRKENHHHPHADRPGTAYFRQHRPFGLPMTLLFDHLTGLGMARERPRELLALLELDGEPGKPICDYSNGMRNRVAMAAALNPSSVRRARLHEMKEILLAQVRRGATMFLTSHVLEVVERLCDRVAIIHDGKLVKSGTMAELRTGSETLEDVFVRVVGADHPAETLDRLPSLFHVRLA